MKSKLINDIVQRMNSILDGRQLKQLQIALEASLSGFDIVPLRAGTDKSGENTEIINKFLSAKRIEGCSEKSLGYYAKTLSNVFASIGKNALAVSTDDLRHYLAKYQENRCVSKVSVDNVRRILSSFFSWLEDEDFIIKSPVRRIKKIKTASSIKDIYSDELLERMRDNCPTIRDLALIDLLASTGMRVGELVRLKRTDVNFEERECRVLGKGDKERITYFDARTKIHLQQYLQSRTDNNASLFVSLHSQFSSLKIGGVEARIRQLGKKAGVQRAHPHKFRRTLATKAIDKGMPIEQVQVLLGHKRIDTTLQYAMVNQNNVKASHKKFLG